MIGIFITGTDTDVGKTWVSKSLIKLLIQKGLDVVPRKPVESGWKMDETLSDAWMLASAANKTEQLAEICPNRFKAPLSPDRAAMLENKILHIDDLKNQCLQGIGERQFLYVEGAGGFYSPLCSDGLNKDLAVALGLSIILVVNDRVGCINHTLLSIEAIEKSKLDLLAIVLNKEDNTGGNDTDTSAMDNQADLQKRCKYPVISLAHNQEDPKPFEEILSMLRI
jgi:dethiobiotin synthetase